MQANVYIVFLYQRLRQSNIRLSFEHNEYVCKYSMTCISDPLTLSPFPSKRIEYENVAFGKHRQSVNATRVEQWKKKKCPEISWNCRRTGNLQESLKTLRQTASDNSSFYYVQSATAQFIHFPQIIILIAVRNDRYDFNEID